METKQATECEQQVTETKQAIESGQSDKVVLDEKSNASNSTDRGNVSTGKGKILSRIWTFILQDHILGIVRIVSILAGICTLLVGTTQLWLISRKNTKPVLGNPEIIVRVAKIAQGEEPEEFLQIKKSIEKVEEDDNASTIDRAIAAAYRLQSAGKINDAIEKWGSIAEVFEESNRDLAAAAWITVGYLHVQKGEVEKALSVYDKVIDLKGY